MAMANRRAVSGSAVRGRAAIIAAALDEAEQRSRAAQQERRRHLQIARERISGVRSSGEWHGRQRRTGASASRFVSGREKKKMVEKNCCVVMIHRQAVSEWLRLRVESKKSRVFSRRVEVSQD